MAASIEDFLNDNPNLGGEDSAHSGRQGGRQSGRRGVPSNRSLCNTDLVAAPVLP
jgi:hypothetical protein